MTFAVDADILGIFQRAEALAPLRALGPLPWVITDEVWYELADGAAVCGEPTHAAARITCSLQG